MFLSLSLGVLLMSMISWDDDKPRCFMH